MEEEMGNCINKRGESAKIKNTSNKEVQNQQNTTMKEKGDALSKSNNMKVADGISESCDEAPTYKLSGKVAEEDLKKLCTQIASFNERIKTSKGLLKIRNEIPWHIQARLDDEAMELDFLYAELTRSLKDIKTISNQREAVAKEKFDLEKQITRLKSDAQHELEVIVSVYDAEMLERWHSVKSTDSQSEVENFLHDVKGKLESMKNLETLATQKLLKITNEVKVDESEKDKKKKNREKQRGNRKNQVIRINRRDSQNRSIPFTLPLLDSDSEGLMEDENSQNALYSLVYGEIMNLPPWIQESLEEADNVDID